MNKVAVIGAGSWGTAVASIAATNEPTWLWARRPELAKEIDEQHRNSAYLAGTELPPSLRGTADLEEACRDADVIVMGVPSHGFRDVLAEAAPHVGPRTPIISLTKGVEQVSLKRMTEVIAELLPGRPAGVLTGPNLAKEILAGFPAASVVALEDTTTCAGLQRLFSTQVFRVYTNPDVIG